MKRRKYKKLINILNTMKMNSSPDEEHKNKNIPIFKSICVYIQYIHMHTYIRIYTLTQSWPLIEQIYCTAYNQAYFFKRMAWLNWKKLKGKKNNFINNYFLKILLDKVWSIILSPESDKSESKLESKIKY